LKKYFILYRPFLLFLAKFFLAYLVLTILYQKYLDSFNDTKIDTITKLVARNTVQVLSLFDNNSSFIENTQKKDIELFYKQKQIVRIIEGCNGVSVIILFISFVIAFSGKLKRTLFFVFGGSLIVYILNVLRIAFLAMLLYSFPKQVHILHGVVFPLLIYGSVFILWVIWVNKFSKYASKTDRK
jgi:exosortase family protein XrtF